MPSGGDLINGRYRLIRLIGEGGMGTVWGARNEAIARDVAIKMMLPEIAADQSNLQRFFNEARVCGSIRHPGIVDVLDLGHTPQGAPFLVMELLCGAPLEAVLDAFGRLTPAEILPMIRDVARTISLAHAKHVVHRDLKPANIFLHRLETGEIIVKVLDFGISKITSGPDAIHATRTGTLVGSPAYMSPEQASGRRDLSGLTDVYAIGVLLYEALAGQLPYEANNYNALIVNIAAGRLRPLCDLEPALPRDVLDLVGDCLRNRPEDRVPSALALAERIESLLPFLPRGRSPSELLEGARLHGAIRAAEAPAADGLEAAQGDAHPSPIVASPDGEPRAPEPAPQDSSAEARESPPRRRIRLGRGPLSALVAVGIAAGAVAAAALTPGAPLGPDAHPVEASSEPSADAAPSAAAAVPPAPASVPTLADLPPPEPVPALPETERASPRAPPRPSGAVGAEGPTTRPMPRPTSRPAPALTASPAPKAPGAWSYD